MLINNSTEKALSLEASSITHYSDDKEREERIIQFIEDNYIDLLMINSPLDYLMDHITERIFLETDFINLMTLSDFRKLNQTEAMVMKFIGVLKPNAFSVLDINRLINIDTPVIRKEINRMKVIHG